MNVFSHPENKLVSHAEGSGFAWRRMRQKPGWVFLLRKETVVVPKPPMRAFGVESVVPDFLCFRIGSKHPIISIEVDGFEFHERTQEQAAGDRRRDRLLLRWGIPTMRFMALELMRDPEACVSEIERVLESSGLDAGRRCLTTFHQDFLDTDALTHQEAESVFSHFLGDT